MSEKALAMLKHMRRQILRHPAPYVEVRGAAISVSVDPGGVECDGLVDELLRAGYIRRYPAPSLTAHGLYRLTELGIAAAEEGCVPSRPLKGLRGAHGDRSGVESLAASREAAMERDDAEFRSANERITTMAEDLRKAEEVRDRLEELNRLIGSYPEGHAMRTRLVELHIERALEGVEQDIRVLMDALQHPRGT